tara:strand:+ start:7079 stop:8710 length:1632 start_codon:yes stop_codon:yes gene_type:complete
MSKTPIVDLSIKSTGFLKVGSTQLSEANLNVLSGVTDISQLTGAKGQKGAAGDLGPQGQEGEKGNTGNPGNPGNPGNKGEKGQQGEVGPKGVDGAKGVMGEKGIQGDAGAMGEAFQVDEFNVHLTDAKVNSIIATSGGTPNDLFLFVVALDSRTSNVISNMSIGNDVTRHVIAYNGSTFISYGPFTGLRGLPGNKGQQGDLGLKGEKGQQGAGTKGEKGQQGNTGNTGLKGDVGPKGDAGAGSSVNYNNFNSNIIPSTNRLYILGDANKQWANFHTRTANVHEDLTIHPGANTTVNGAMALTNGSSLDVLPGATVNVAGQLLVGGQQVTGGAGQKGDKGQQGNTGNTGLKGDVGPKGADGSNGSNGAKGQQGEVGPKGADGSNGSKGAKGQQGEVGPKGEPGVGGGGGGGGSGIQKLPTNFLDMVSPSYHSSGNIYESGASVRPVTIPAHGSIYWAVDAQWISGSPGVYLWIWLSNTQYNATSNDNILENALFVPGSVPSTPPGFWRAQKFANPGIPNTLTEAAGWPEGGQNGYPAYDPSSLL